MKLVLLLVLSIPFALNLNSTVTSSDIYSNLPNSVVTSDYYSTIKGKFIKPIRIITTTDNIRSTEDILYVDTSSNAVGVTLSTTEVISGRTVTIKDSGGNAGTNSILVSTQGSETIDGASTQTLNTDYESITVCSDGSNWFNI